MDENSANTQNRPVFKTEEIPDIKQDIQPVQFPQPAATQAINPLEPGSHVKIPGNKIAKPHFMWKLFFLVPVILIVGTMALVATLTRNDFVISEEKSTEQIYEETVTPEPSKLPLPVNSRQLFENDIYSFTYSDEMDVVSCSSEVYLVLSNTDLTGFCDNIGSNNYAIKMSFIEIDSTQTEDEKTKMFLAGSNNLLVQLIDEKYTAEFKSIVSSIKILVDISANWEKFENTKYGYEIKYPVGWVLVHDKTDKDGKNDSPRSAIRKTLNNAKLQNLVINSQTELKNAALTATETISATSGLLGWEEKPSTQITTVGGVNAQIIEGIFEGAWEKYIVIWYKTSVYEMVWTDNLERTNEQVINEILKTFQVY